jgi:dihydroneopterin aldolase
MTQRDRVTLRGLRGFGRHGVLVNERQEGQSFLVDVALGLDTRRAAGSDDLADTVDYGDLAGRVVAVVEGEPVNLLETLAQRIADLCLGHPLVEQVEVTVHKPFAPVAVPFDDVTVTIQRSRS